MILRAGGGVFAFPRLPLVMGSVCIREGDVASAEHEAKHLAARGAELVSVRTQGAATQQSEPQTEQREDALCAFIQAWKAAMQTEPLVIPVASPEQARAVLAAGADCLTVDVSSPNPLCAPYAMLCHAYGAGLVLDYGVTQEAPDPELPLKENFLTEVDDVFSTMLREAAQAGLAGEAVILGVRLAWSNKVESDKSLWLCSHVRRFHAHGRPLLLTDFFCGEDGTSLEGAPCGGPKTQTARAVSRIVHGMLAGMQLFQTGNVHAACSAVRTIAAVLS